MRTCTAPSTAQNCAKKAGRTRGMIRTLGAVALLMAVYAAAAASPAFVLQCPLSSGWGSLTHPAAHPRVKEARARCAAAPQRRRRTRTAAELSAGGLPGAGSGHPGEDLCSLSVSFSWPDFVADALSRSLSLPTASRARRPAVCGNRILHRLPVDASCSLVGTGYLKCAPSPPAHYRQRSTMGDKH